MQQGQGGNPIHPVAGGLQSEPTIADPDEDDMADDDNVEMRAGDSEDEDYEESLGSVREHRNDDVTGEQLLAEEREAGDSASCDHHYTVRQERHIREGGELWSVEAIQSEG